MGKKRSKPIPPPKKTLVSISYHSVLILSLLLFVLLALLSFDPKPYLGGDNATYMLLAKSMIQGNGYRDIWAPGMPPQTQYPFGFPLLLLPGIMLFPHSIIPLKFFVLALALASVALVAALGKKTLPRVQSLSLMFLLCLNVVFIEYSHWVLTEVPFICISFLALFLLMDREKDSFQKDGLFWLSLLAIAFCYYIRTAGIALVFALPLYLLLKRRWLTFGMAGAALFLLLLPWFLRNRGLLHEGVGYSNVLLLKDTYNPAAGYVTLSDLLIRLGTNIKIYSLSVVSEFFFPSLYRGESAGLVSASALFSTILCLLGFWTQAKRKLGLIHIYILCHVGVTLMCPTYMSERRILLPILPLLLSLFISGAFSLSGLLWRKKPKVIGVCLIAISALSALWANLQIIPTQLQNSIAYMKGDEFAGYPENWSTFFQAADWVKANTDPSAIVVCRKPTLFYLRAERRTFTYPFSTNSDSVLSEIFHNHADYVFVDQVSNTTSRYLIPALQPYIPERFELVYATPEPTTYVFRVKPPSLR